jgi:hypothetical protein
VDAADRGAEDCVSCPSLIFDFCPWVFILFLQSSILRGIENCGRRKSAWLTAKHSIFYVIALWISTSLGNGKKITDNWGSLLDYRGFLDARYSVLCVGAFLAQLGQWTPSYYISECFSFLLRLWPEVRIGN